MKRRALLHHPSIIIMAVLHKITIAALLPGVSTLCLALGTAQHSTAARERWSFFSVDRGWTLASIPIPLFDHRGINYGNAGASHRRNSHDGGSMSTAHPKHEKIQNRMFPEVGPSIATKRPCLEIMSWYGRAVSERCDPRLACSRH